MRVYQYWSMGSASSQRGRFSVWRGSNESLQHAQQLANEAARELAANPKVLNRSPESYSYQTRFVPEQVVSTFPAPDGSLLAAVTRNRYGALVLNTADVVIIDADIVFPPTQSATGPGLLSWLFGKPPATEARGTPDPAEKRLAQIRQAVAQFPDHLFRIYRTHAGYRIFLLDQRCSPADPLARQLLDAFQADRNYQNLCQVQQSYRARLTPKPFNLGVDYPTVHYPYPDSLRETAESWQQRYESASQSFRVCQPIQEIGSGERDPDVNFLLQLHDEACRVQADLPLA